MDIEDEVVKILDNIKVKDIRSIKEINRFIKLGSLVGPHLRSILSLI